MASGDGERPQQRSNARFYRAVRIQAASTNPRPPVSSSRQNTREAFSTAEIPAESRDRKLNFPAETASHHQQSDISGYPSLFPLPPASIKISNRGRIRSILKYAGRNGDNGETTVEFRFELCYSRYHLRQVCGDDCPSRAQFCTDILTFSEREKVFYFYKLISS
jgi:hypothetical protein